MGSMTATLHGFNRGLVSQRAMARVDLERMRLSAETQTNWTPRSLGSMMLRPGLQYVLGVKDNLACKYIPFFYSTTQTALLECTGSILRPIINEAVVTRTSVSTTVTNGDFSSSAGWTITANGGATGVISGGNLSLYCYPIESYLVVSRTVSVSGGDQNKEHAFRIKVDRGSVVFRAGHTASSDGLVSQTILGEGTHSLAFTPTSGTVYIEFESRGSLEAIVDSIQIESAGTLTLPTPWAEADLSKLRYSQSGDVVFVSCDGYQTYRIERRTTTSWSIVKYKPLGPFSAIPGDPNVKMSIDKPLGTATVTASRPYFRSTDVGGLLRFFTPGYNHSFDLGKEKVYTPAVRVNGVGTARAVSIVTTGTWVGTLTVQKSYVGEDTGFTDTATTITSNTTTTVTDTADNTAVWIRVGFNSGGYTSGTATAQLVFGVGGASGGSSSGWGVSTGQVTSVGGRTGMCRITNYSSTTQCTVEVLSIFSSTLETADWQEGEWSDRYGWPSANTFHEGRLFFAGRDKIWGSISDSFSSFDPGQDGDSGPIQRSIGYGPVQVINWLVSLTRLFLGTEGSEVSVKSSSFDEPLTPTNFSLKDTSTFGSARLPAVKIDNRCIFVDKSGIRVYEMVYSVESNDYQARDLTQLVPDINIDNPIVGIAVQRQPDTRVHCLREDGTVAVLVFEPAEDVKCWVEYETDGVVEDAVVLPGDEEDKVYYVVRRVINGATKRYLERFAMESECVGGTLNKQADSFIVYSGAATTTITGLSHLEGENVIVWADGVDLSPDDENRNQTVYAVSSGSITLDVEVEDAIVGLPYEARFKSTKLAYAAQRGTALNHRKRVSQLGLQLYKTHHKGLYHGMDFGYMNNLPAIEFGTTVAEGRIWDNYDANMIAHPGKWETDARLCLLAKAPRPCNVMAAVIDIETNG